MTSSFDHLVGAGIQRHGPDDMERPGGPQVDDRLKPDRRLYWQVFGVGTPEDAADQCAAGDRTEKQQSCQKEEGRSEMGFPFFQNGTLIGRRGVRVIRGC